MNVPPSTQSSINGLDDDVNGQLGSCDTWSSGRSLSLSGLPDWGQLDEEHRLIAHYAACLAGHTTSPGCESTDSNQSFDPHKTKRNLVMALEKKNKEITKQINKIKEQQEKCEGGRVNPALVNELKALRSHRTQLESHLISLQDSRKSLLGQLEGLMKLLKTSTTSTTTASTITTTSTDFPPQSLKSPPHSSVATMGSVPSLPSTNGGGPRSAPPTPSHTNHYSSLDSIPQEHLGSSGLSSLRSSCFGSLGHQGSLGHNTGSLGHHSGSLGHSTGSLGHNQGIFAQGSLANHKRHDEDQDGDLSPESEGEKLRNDLLLAADSVTNAMSSLVRELNSESSEEETQQQRRRSLRETDTSSAKWRTQNIRMEEPTKREVPNVQRRSQRSASCGGVRMPPARDSWSEPPAGLLKR